MCLPFWVDAIAGYWHSKEIEKELLKSETGEKLQIIPLYLCVHSSV